MKAPADIGALDQRILLETQTPASVDDSGGRLSVPVVGTTIWAAVAYAKSSPTEDDARLAVRQEIDVTLRWRADVTRDSAVIWRGQRYSVLAIDTPDTQCRWLMLRCVRDA